ncbi:MAG: NAD(P)H-dependent oxidoreductase [Melioribacteraceae bacterium]|nr:NAD(P)H-dependent oxidoreductase [Melioribacteraceae bacterium]MCF8264674.1 NAD(P)H-dependent oxidoreductase [Melioribacteraceae bacterium]MCF8431598.1 NAD(P)H-dependent oxidoreductase [Melioribacteraceae bacterium]
MSLKVAVIYGSVRSSRQGIKAAKFIRNKCDERGWETTLLDPLELGIPLIDKMYKEYDEENTPEYLIEPAKVLQDSDGFIVVSGEYNHAAPPALLNLMNYFQKEYHWKPSAIVSYSAGPFGGVRAAMHLRSYLNELGTPSIPSILPISKVYSSIDENGKAVDESYNKRSIKFLDEFDWYLKAFKEARNNGTPY